MAGILFVPVGVLVALVALVAGRRGRLTPVRALAVVGTGLAFVGLAPSGCGELTSYPPHVSCVSLAGSSWSLHPTPGSVWADHTMLAVQGVLLARATLAAVGLLALATLYERWSTARGRRASASVAPR